MSKKVELNSKLDAAEASLFEAKTVVLDKQTQESLRENTALNSLRDRAQSGD